MKLLAVDASSLVASVAILEDDIVIAEYTVNHKKTHSQTLMGMLDEIVRMTQTDLKSIDAIAVSGGPGSFTGLRIASATVKGLGLALEKPIVSVPTIDAMAYSLWGVADLICPMMDARRNQVYTGVYTFADGEFKTVLPQCAMEIESLADYLNAAGKKCVILGDGVPVGLPVLKEKLTVPFEVAPAHVSRQRAAAVGALGMRYYEAGKIETADAHQPDYLRVSQAERERKERLEKVVIEKLTEDDLDGACALEEATFSMPWTKDDFRDMIARSYSRYLVAKIDGKVVGLAGLLNMAGDGEITNVAVGLEYRRYGIAKRLLEQLMAEAGEDGVSAYTLEVRSSNAPAIALYEKLGFVSEGVRPNFYEKPVEDALIMWKR